MKVIQLNDELHDYLVHVLRRYTASGIDPAEGLAVYHLWSAVTKDAQHVDPSKLTQIEPATQETTNG